MSCTLVSFASNADVIIKSYFDKTNSYIDVYTFILNSGMQGDSLDFKSVESLVVISDTAGIVVAEKYLFKLTPNDTNDIVDLKKYKLENGSYTIRIELLDLVSNSIIHDHSQKIELNYTSDKFAHSDMYLSLYSPEGNPIFNKHGVCLEPLPYQFCLDQDQLTAYSELYNLDKITNEDVSVGLILYEGNIGQIGKVKKKKYKRLSPKDYIPAILTLDISDVISGDYHIAIEVATKNKEILSFKESNITIQHDAVDFMHGALRNKEFKNSFVQDMLEGELDYNLKAIYPQVSPIRSEILTSVIKGNNLESKRYFLYRFWVNQSADNPELLFNKYMEVADAVDKSYNSNVGFGFETDRGYIFLKYGKPSNQMSVEDEPTAPPYEIWLYNTLPETGQSNVKFLFYNPSLSTNDYILLHSTCRGEKSNPRWEIELYKSDPTSPVGDIIDGRSVRQGYNRNARKFFEEF